MATWSSQPVKVGGAVASVLCAMALLPGAVVAEPDMPSAAEVREALETLRRFERAVEAQNESATEAQSMRPAPTERTRDSIGASDVREPLTANTVGGGASLKTVVAPGGYSLSLDGDVSLGGFVFKEGYAFLHNDGGLSSQNTALGIDALVSATPGMPAGISGTRNTALGSSALHNNTSGFQNTACGEDALESNTAGFANTACGAGALEDNTSGYRNAAIGYIAMTHNTVAKNNTAVGSHALVFNTTSDGNTAVGQGAAFYTTGPGNTAMGRHAMYNNTTGTANTAIGYNAGAIWTTGFNNIAIGRGAYGLAGDDGVIRIGGFGFQHEAYIEGIFGTTIVSGPTLQVYINSSNQLGTGTSSARFKQDIHDLEGVSDRLQDLRPVSFRYKNELVGLEPGAHNALEYGLIAEEVAEIFPELVANDEKGKPYTVRYHLLTPLLLAEVQRQTDEIAELRAVDSEIAELRRKFVEQERLLRKLLAKEVLAEGRDPSTRASLAGRSRW